MNKLKNFYIFRILRETLNLLDQFDMFGISQISTLVERIFHCFYQIEILFVELERILLHFGQIKEIIDKIEQHFGGEERALENAFNVHHEILREEFLK